MSIISLVPRQLALMIALSCILSMGYGWLPGAIAQQKSERQVMAYPQLIATRYPKGKPLPNGVHPPKPSFDFVDRKQLPANTTILSAAQAHNGATWVITPEKGYRISRSKDNKIQISNLEPPRLLRPHQPAINEDTFINCIATDRDGHIWVGTTAGLYVTDGASWWHALDRNDGMPIEDIRCLFLAGNGDVWAGTHQGAWRLREGRFRYFAGQRWLPDNRVRAIWGPDPAHIWIETENGYSLIAERTMTLAEKARLFNSLTQQWNNRHGYISERSLKTPGELRDSVFSLSDNDGLWNAIYVGAMAFRYAATKDPQAKQEAKRQAWQAMEAMLELERLTGIPGYPARVVVTDAELAAGTEGFDPKETVRVKGETTPIWFRSPVQKDVWCKGDTSSDELDGHYFAWLLYSDLVATPEEKQRIATACRRVTDRIIQGNYTLIGHTGKRTLWGFWSPELLNDDPAYWDQRALNSLELLSYLKLAEYLTGDLKYQQHYEKLIRDYHYLLNTLAYRIGYIGQWEHLNHSDDEMAYMNYYILLKLEKDPDRRRLLQQSFRNTWEGNGLVQPLKPERSPLYNYLYGGLTGRPCAPDEAVETLQDWPWERVNWTMTNSQRADVTFKAGRGLHASTELTQVLPIAERSLHRWNHNPWKPDGGEDGRSYDDGAAWLLGYWAGVYFGYLP